MFRNYLVITLRNFKSNLLYVLINVLGLGLALAVCIVAYISNKYDADFDTFHEHAKQIYRIEVTRQIEDRSQAYGISPVSLAPLVKENIGGIQDVVRVVTSYLPVKLGENVFNKGIAYCDSAFFKMFTLDLVSGTSESFGDMNSIIISDEMGEIYFGNEDPVGEIISLVTNNEERTYLVAGVFRKFPLNSSFTFDALLYIDNYFEIHQVDEHDWQTAIAGTFLLVPDRSQIPVIEELLQEYITIQNEAQEQFRIERYYLAPFSDMAHRGGDLWSHWFRHSFHPAAVTAPPLMAIFILLLACFNFMNNAIAFSSKRLKEIGVRKVVGGNRRQIIWQFMGENMVLSLLAVVIGLIIGEYLVEIYSRMWIYMDVSLSFKSNPELLIFVILLFLIASLLAGAYPSFYISRFNPVFIFQDKLRIGGRNILSKILLTLQFIISANALISGVIFTENARFQDNLYLGYDKDNIIGVPVNDPSYFIAFRDAIKANPKIESVGESEEHIGRSNFSRPIDYKGIRRNIRALDIGYGYFNTMGLKLTDGREFPAELKSSDIENSVIVSKAFVEEFGMETVVGERIMMGDTMPLYIVGVVEDLYLYGFWSKKDPMLFRRGVDERMRTLAVRGAPENLGEINEYLEKTWKEIIPNQPYEGFFQDDLMDEARDVNRNIKNINIFLAFLAIIISAIGLYTLVSLSIIRRTKEIGIRKVNGAPIFRIAGIISREYMIILAIACILGSVSGYWVSVMLMDSIWDAFTDIRPFVYIFSNALILVVAIASIGWKVNQAARRNPVDSLRYE
ncbi:MAG: FtsX-like permease family protein [Bacteroidales bacterium]|nr:FtsX-like permease family protein [Bacteroidales bacterium]